MSLILQIITVVLLGIYISVEVERIKTNKELIAINKKVIEGDKKVCEVYEETKCKLEEKNKILKKQNEEIDKIKKYFEDINQNLSIDYNKLTEEVIKRINKERNSDININI